MVKGKKIGLALSGGGARGIAHIGVLKALEENGIEIDSISGASAGAIIATLHAAGLSIDQMLEIVAESSLFKAFKLVVPNTGLTSLSYLKGKLTEVISLDDFSILSKPVFIAISNLNKGTLEFKNDGPLFDVVTASSSVPLIFKPVEIAGETYVDGGLLCNLPVEPLRAVADYIIGVDVMPSVEVENKSLNGWVGITTRCFELSIHANTIPQKKLCNQVVEVKGVVKYNIFQFNKYKELYELGYQAAMEKMDKVLNDLNEL